jgi:3-methyladenine DNA glycosylase AlkD
MTEATMQSTLLSKENFTTEKTKPKITSKRKRVFPEGNTLCLIAKIKKAPESEISSQKLKKLKFLLKKTQEAQKFDEEFLNLEILDSETCKIKQLELIDNFVKFLIEQAKNSPI